MLLEKMGARKTLLRILFLWGLAAAGMAFVQTPMQFYVLRFLLGAFEAGFFPGVILYLTYWYPSARRAKAIAMIHSSYGEGLDIKRLAKMVGVSQSQFERLFNRILGTTPCEYLLRVRIAAARALLENSDRTIADIACETGFYDHSHFTRTFKRIVGVSPGKYRKGHSEFGI